MKINIELNILFVLYAQYIDCQLIDEIFRWPKEFFSFQNFNIGFDAPIAQDENVTTKKTHLVTLQRLYLSVHLYMNSSWIVE